MTATKRIVSILLLLTLLVGMVPAPVQAEEVQTSVDNGGTTIEGTNSFGTLLSEDIQEQQAAQEEAYAGGYNIVDLTIENGVAIVEYDTLEEANLVVSLYTEDGLQLLVSGNGVVQPEETEVVITLEGDIPEYFMASAYLLDTYDYSPLCPSYSTPMYTKEMQDLLAATTDDYDADKVLKLDDDKTTNFAVYADTTKVIDYVDGVNTVVSANDETATYIIENADENITSLQAGDVVAYIYGEEQILIVKVASVSVNGTTATITGTDLEMEEVFSHVKIESINGTGNLVVDEDTAQEGISYDGLYSEETEAPDTRAAEGGNKWKDYLGFSLVDAKIVDENASGAEVKVSVDGNVGIGLDISFSYYISSTREFVEFKTVVDIQVNMKFEGAVAGKIPLPKIKSPSLFGLTVGFEPVLKIEVKGSIEIGIAWQSTIGFSYDNINGIQNLSTTPKLESKLELKASLFFGVDMAPTAEMFGGFVIETKAEIPIGVECVVDNKAETLSQEYLHSCNTCYAIEVFFKIEFSVKLKCLNSDRLTLKSESEVIKFKLFDMYWSVDQDKLGIGQCPNKSYKIVISVKNPEGELLPGVRVTGLRNSTGEEETLGVTNNKGVLVAYLPADKYTIRAEVLGKLYTSTVQTNEVTKVTLLTAFTGTGTVLDKVESELVKDYGSVIDSGQCGANGDVVTWQMYSSGMLVISGKGAMRDFKYTSAPWSDYSDKITGVYVNQGVTSIGYGAFDYCTSLTVITIPDSVTNIGEAAFFCCTSLTGITIPDSVTTVGGSTFRGCTSLTELTIPDSVTTIGDWAFEGCTSLTEITIPDSVISVGDKAFYNCTGLTSVAIGDSVTTVEGSTFRGCTSLTEITIPDSVISVGDMAFYNCTSLTEIAIPDSVISVGDKAFCWCTSLTGIYVNEGNTVYCNDERGVLFDKDKTTLIQAPGGIFGSYTIPDSITTIGDWAFSYCDSLTEITIPDSVTSIGDCAFWYCDSLTKITIPDSVTTIGDWAFEGCTSLTEITIPDSVTSIGENAFGNCTSLAWVTISDSVTTIGERAFSDCTSLTEITIPDSVTSIGDSAFDCCTSLTEITIPDSVTSIGEYAFYWCKSLTDVYYGGTQEQWAAISIGSSNECLINATIHYSSAAAAMDVQMSAPETVGVAENATVIERVVRNAVYGGEYETEETDTYTLKTASFTGLIPGEEYVLLALVSIETADVLAPDNLLYINQAVAAEDGTLVFTYVQRVATDISYVMACGASHNNLEDATITFPTMLATEEAQAVNPTVVYDGKTLTEGVDYVIVGKADYTEAGEYTCSIRGIYGYTGMVECTYTVLDCIPGDLDNSGTVTTDDAIKLLLYISMPDMFPIDAPADFNGDGTVTTDDAIQLLLHISMPDMFPL